MSPRGVQRSGAPSLKGKALQWLSQREHSRLELGRKLGRWHAAQQECAGRAAIELSGTPGTNAIDATAADSESSNAIDKVLNELAAAGLLSDARFAQSRLHQRQSRFGNRRIEQELKQHGLAPTEDQRDELRSNEAQRALAVLRKRLKAPIADPIDAPIDHIDGASASAELQSQNSGFDRGQLLKAQRFLAGRGFSSEAIRKALRRLGEAEDQGN